MINQNIISNVEIRKLWKQNVASIQGEGEQVRSKK